jgi:hypothetical protein
MDSNMIDKSGEKGVVMIMSGFVEGEETAIML